MAQDKSTNEQQQAQDIDIDDIEVVILVVAKTPRNLNSAAAFLSRRGWPTTVTGNLSQAIEFATDKKPDFVLISVNHPNPAIGRFSDLLTNTFGTTCVAFAEGMDTASNAKLNKSRIVKKIPGQASGPNLHRSIRKLLAEKLNIQLEDKSADDRQSSQGAGDNRVTVKGNQAGDGGTIVQKNDPGATHGKGPTLVKGEGAQEDHDGGSDTEVVSTGKYTMTTKNRRSLKDLAPRENPLEAAVKAKAAGSADLAAQLKRSLFGDEPEAQHADSETEDSGSITSRTSASSGKIPLSSVAPSRDSSGGTSSSTSAGGAANGGISAASTGSHGNQSSGNQSGATSTSPSATGSSGSTGSSVSSGPSAASGGASGSQAGAATDSAGGSSQGHAPATGSTLAERIARAGAAAAAANAAKDAAAASMSQSGAAGGAKGYSMTHDQDLNGIGTESLIQRAVQTALQRICRPGSPNPAPIHMIEQVGVFPVDSPNVPGYLVLAWPNDEMRAKEAFFKSAQQIVQAVFLEMGIQARLEPGFFVTLPEVDFVNWTQESAAFSFSTAHGEEEIGVAYFSTKKPIPKPRQIEDKSMYSIGLENISTEQPVTFKVYLHMKKNKKYFLYLRNGRQLQPEQMARLKDKDVKDLYMKSIDVENLRMFLAACFLRKKIKNPSEEAA